MTYKKSECYVFGTAIHTSIVICTLCENCKRISQKSVQKCWKLKARWGKFTKGRTHLWWKGDGKPGRRDERLEKIERSGPYFVRNGTTIITDKMVRPTNVGARRGLTTSLALDVMKYYKVSAMNIFFALFSKVVVEWGSGVPDKKVRPTFVNSRCLMRGYISTIRDGNLDKNVIIASVKYKK